MRKLTFLSFLLLFLSSLPVVAQQRSTSLTIQVTAVEGISLRGQAVTLMQTDYQVGYGTLSLDAKGMCVVKVYPGHHLLSIEREGFVPVSQEFEVAESEAEKTVSVTLTEKTRTPYALTAAVSHNVFNGLNDIQLSWNTEAPAFFDDFESYEPFAVAFGEWTGIDADQEAAAPLIGSYPNRGVMQYAQIINPLTVQPTWWYDYPILRPYDGQQYVGFTRTNSGNANDDWLITPAISVGTDNVFSFMAKAADRFPERFMVYVTTKTDSPVQSDFVRLDQDNYETADYTRWRKFAYDLSAYAGKQVKLAIRYISDYGRFGSFMLMVDNVFVGQEQAEMQSRSMRRSPANPYEVFSILLDGKEVGTTDGYKFTVQGVPSGQHTLGVQASYVKAVSEVATIQVDVPAANYAHVVFNVSAQSKLSPNGQLLSVTSLETSDTYELTVADGKAELPSLPVGQYVVNVAEGAFVHYQQTITVTGNQTFDVVLADRVLTPYNITATADEKGQYTLRWNQELSFCESFEDYPDFATGTFGEWKSYDLDQNPVYPIALGGMSNIVSFPGSGTANNPTPLAPMVFNPWHTTPAMLPTDPAIKAPSGDKTVVFFSAQQSKNDKWLVSPLFNIRPGFSLRVTAKGYSEMYPESMEFCVSEGGSLPSDFVALSKVDQLTSTQWTVYSTDLSGYEGETVRLAVHYTSYDAFLAQIDDFTVGSDDGQGEVIDFGNVVRYDIYVDGQKVGESTTPSFVLPVLSADQHTVSICAVYQSSQSEMAEYVIGAATGLASVKLDGNQPSAVYSLSGQYMGQRTAHLPAGIYVVKQNGKTKKLKL